MGKSVPIWLFLLCVLLGSVFTLLFGSFVKSTAGGSARFGRLGQVSVVIASFPELVRDSFRGIGEGPDTHLRLPLTNIALADFHPVRMHSGIHVQGLVVRADRAALARAPGWRILVGTFVIDGELNHAALALSPEFEVVKAWVLREDGIQGQKPRSTSRKNIHGFALLKDGSMIFTWTGGVSIQRFDKCGRKIWSTGGVFDHIVALDDDESFVWTVSNDYDSRVAEVVRVSTATGKVIQRFSMASIVAANPMIDILGVLRDEQDDFINSGGHPNYRNTTERWRIDPFHLNDVEPLPAAIANRFEDFAAGDLLLSARSLNLVFVIDPETLKVKWWESGAWRRQHDPDWQPTGEITVYDNRSGRDYSRIVSIVPPLRKTRVVFDGRTNDFYSNFQGKHQITKAGNILITSPRQGRAFEIDRNGQLVFEMFNVKPGSKEFVYHLSEAIWLPLETFDFARNFLCAE